jgi:GxxExxY protein
MEQNEITGEIVSAAMKVHSVLGPGLMESAYTMCLELELLKRGLKVERERVLPIVYDGTQIDVGYRVDLLIEDCVIVEVKAAKAHPVYEGQLLSYLKLGGLHVGLLINFFVPSMKDGIKRMVN